ncbi:MAG: OprO/OprP family phosphate-selective porin, partial [candidate division Zixibacteria bacterium]|nr:OprO/OprP family phosphate-selective porin [candidate division Zixibacteria bacterium]
EKQWGFYGQALYNLFDRVLPMFPQSVLAVGTRYDYIDLDADIVGAHLRRFTFGVNLRPVPETVLKLNYVHNWEFDRINNEVRSAALQFGIATYF